MTLTSPHLIYTEPKYQPQRRRERLMRDLDCAASQRSNTINRLCNAGAGPSSNGRKTGAA